jgi:hypothetical protein
MFLCLAVIICAVVGIVVRFSYVQNGFGTENYRFMPWPVNASMVFSKDNLKITSVNDLVRDSDVIVKCKFTGGMTISDSEYYFPVNVEKVYKGDNTLYNNNIIIEEDIYTFVSQKSINSIGGLFPLKQGEDYILLLKKDNVSKYFAEKDIRNSEYKLLTESPFGEYRISNFKSVIVPNLNNSINYISFTKTYDFLVDSKATLDEYSLFRSQLLSKFYY